MQKQLLTELAASGAAEEVQRHAAATDWPDIADLIQQDLTDPNDMMIHQQQPNALIQTYANSTAGMGAMCSAKGPQCLPTSAAAAISKQHSHDRKAHDTRYQTCNTHLQQHGAGMSGMQLPASTTYSDAAAHPDTAIDSNMADDCNRKTHLSKAKRKRNRAVSLEQYRIEENHRAVQPETPEQGYQARSRSTFGRRDNSSSEGTTFARPKMGDIVWAKLLNHPYWPAQVSMTPIQGSDWQSQLAADNLRTIPCMVSHRLSACPIALSPLCLLMQLVPNLFYGHSAVGAATYCYHAVMLGLLVKCGQNVLCRHKGYSKKITLTMMMGTVTAVLQTGGTSCRILGKPSS